MAPMHATTIIRTVCILTSLHASMWTRVWQILVPGTKSRNIAAIEVGEHDVGRSLRESFIRFVRRPADVGRQDERWAASTQALGARYADGKNASNSASVRSGTSSGRK